MGKPLTERQKARRAVKAVVRKQVKLVGPLYADQVEVPDETALLLKRRMGLARLVEQGQEVEGNRIIGGGIVLRRLRELARQHLPADFAALDAHCKGTYPTREPYYATAFWIRHLTTTEAVTLRYRRVPDAGVTLGYRAVPDLVFPPPGFTPPLTRAELPLVPPRCDRCRYYHEPHHPCEV